MEMALRLQPQEEVPKSYPTPHPPLPAPHKTLRLAALKFLTLAGCLEATRFGRKLYGPLA